jgi:hypothetical protein
MKLSGQFHALASVWQEHELRHLMDIRLGGPQSKFETGDEKSELAVQLTSHLTE